MFFVAFVFVLTSLYEKSTFVYLYVQNPDIWSKRVEQPVHLLQYRITVEHPPSYCQ